MGIFDGINVAEQAMGVHRLRSEVTAENIANVYTPGYRRKVVDVQANNFNSAMSRASSGTTTFGAGQGAVRITGIRTDGVTSPDNQRQQALQGVVEMMRSKSAFELNLRSATMLKSMALSSLEIGRGG